MVGEHNVNTLSSDVRVRFSSFRVHYDNSQFQTDEVGNDDDEDDNHVRSLWGALAGPSPRITAYDADNYSLIRRLDKLPNGNALKSQSPHSRVRNLGHQPGWAISPKLDIWNEFKKIIFP